MGVSAEGEGLAEVLDTILCTPGRTGKAVVAAAGRQAQLAIPQTLVTADLGEAAGVVGIHLSERALVTADSGAVKAERQAP